MTVFFTMQKLFPTKWTNKVLNKLILIDNKSPNILLCHILDGTLNPKLKVNNLLSMNNTTFQVLARATPHFTIPISNEDTKPWSFRKMEQCYNCKTVICNRTTCTRPPLIPGNHRQCFNCREDGCHFLSFPHPIDKARCKRNKTLFSTSMKPSLKVLPIVLSGNRVQDINRQRMAWMEAKNEAAWLETKKNLTHYQRYVWRFPSEEEHGKCVIH